MKNLLIVVTLVFSTSSLAAEHVALRGCFKSFLQIKGGKRIKNPKYFKGLYRGSSRNQKKMKDTVGAAVATMQLADMMLNYEKVGQESAFTYDIASADLKDLLDKQRKINESIDDFNLKNGTNYYPFTTIDTMNYLFLRLKYKKEKTCRKISKNSFLLPEHLSDIEDEMYLARYARLPENTEIKEFHRGCLSKVSMEKISKEQALSFNAVNAAYVYKDFIRAKRNRRVRNLPPEIVELVKMHEQLKEDIDSRGAKRGKKYDKVNFYEFTKILRFINENNPRGPLCRKKLFSKNRYTIYPFKRLKKKLSNYILDNYEDIKEEISTKEEEYVDHIREQRRRDESKGEVI
jgi:hypothetical protein